MYFSSRSKAVKRKTTYLMWLFIERDGNQKRNFENVGNSKNQLVSGETKLTGYVRPRDVQTAGIATRLTRQQHFCYDTTFSVTVTAAFSHYWTPQLWMNFELFFCLCVTLSKIQDEVTF